MKTPKTPQIGDRVHASHLPNNLNCAKSECPQLEGVVRDVGKGVVRIYDGSVLTDVNPSRGWGISIYPEFTDDVSGRIPFQRVPAAIHHLQELDNGSI